MPRKPVRVHAVAMLSPEMRQSQKTAGEGGVRLRGRRTAGVTAGVTISALVVLTTCALAQSVAPSAPSETGSGGFEVGIELAATAIAWLTAHARAIVSAAYERAPTLMIVLAALLVVPLTALAGLAAHAAHGAHSARKSKQAALARIATLAAEPAPTITATARWPTEAWLTGDGIGHFVLPRGQALVRIGRHDDNDVRLADRSVHRHHALLHRTPEGHYVLTDLSGREGNGLLVNGERRIETRLASGDAITLGNILLRFETKPL